MEASREEIAGQGDDDVVVRKSGDLAYVVLNRPAKRNAMTERMWNLIPVLVEQIERDDTVRAVVFRGAGETAFSAGGDIAEFGQVYADAARTLLYNEAVRTAQLAIERMSKPSVAMIHGACVGGGCGIALSCDFRFAADDSRLGITPSRLGLAYSVPDTRRLVALAGPSHAKDILFSGRLVGASEALQMGLLNRVVPKHDLDREVSDYVALLVANSRQSLQVSKTMVNALSGVNPVAEAQLHSLFMGTFSSQDFREGVAAFLEKRQPNFQ